MPEDMFVADLPSGTVTFLFSDVESSTTLLERHPKDMGAALLRHREIFEQIVDAHGGGIFETVGDAVYAAFGRATDAVAAGLDIQLALAGAPPSEPAPGARLPSRALGWRRRWIRAGRAAAVGARHVPA